MARFGMDFDYCSRCHVGLYVIRLRMKYDIAKICESIIWGKVYTFSGFVRSCWGNESQHVRFLCASPTLDRFSEVRDDD